MSDASDQNSGWLFAESQRMRIWWIWVLMIGGTVGLIAALFQLQVFEKELEPAIKIVVAIATISLILAMVLIYIMRLDTKINESAVYFRFYPLHREYRFREWSELNRAYVRKYNPILEYGGWGIRYGLTTKGWAYNMSGNIGLQLEMKNGKRLLLGTRQADELNRVMKLLTDKKIISPTHQVVK